jgi:hypothetical protein
MNIDDFGPCYEFGWPDQPVDLATNSRAEVQIGQKLYSGTATAQLILGPSIEVVVLGTFTGTLGEKTDKLEPKTVKFRVEGREMAGVVRQITRKEDYFTIGWSCTVESTFKGDGATAIDHIVFHLMDYQTPGHPFEPSCPFSAKLVVPRGVRDLSAAGWEIRLRKCSENDLTVNWYEYNDVVWGRWDLARIGYVRREDGLSFTGETALDLLDALQAYWSLLSGFSCAVVLPVGFDSQRNRIWEHWPSPVHAPEIVHSLHPEIPGDGFFEGFLKRWENEGWRDAIRAIEYWYLVSNSMGNHADAGIVLAQAALERLSYQYVVRDRKLLRRESFKDLAPSDQFRLLLVSLGIPTDIPESLEGLSKFIGKMAKKERWVDAPHALTEIRNSIVHAEKKQYGNLNLPDVYSDAWRLGLWLLELALLRVLGYDGNYVNRLRDGDHLLGDPIPWLAGKGLSSDGAER